MHIYLKCTTHGLIHGAFYEDFVLKYFFAQKSVAYDCIEFCGHPCGSDI